MLPFPSDLISNLKTPLTREIISGVILSFIMAKTASDWSAAPDEAEVPASAPFCLNSTKPPERAFLFVSLIQTESTINHKTLFIIAFQV